MSAFVEHEVVTVKKIKHVVDGYGVLDPAGGFTWLDFTN